MSRRNRDPRGRKPDVGERKVNLRELAEHLGLSVAVTLYGRTGVIFCNDQPAIAVLELLAPI